jgi:glycosyltransferase involved in cell wall biosynthesis
MFPKVSCICPTYNRVATQKYLLEETVESFLRQDYPNKELIIINDHPKQKILLKNPHPEIYIINYFERFSTLGRKYNHAINSALGELICTWEDDDISLPNRLSVSVDYIGNHKYFNPRSYFFLSGDIFQFDGQGYSHNCSMFTKEAWKEVGGYPEVSGPQDAQMDGRLRSLNDTIDGRDSLKHKEWFYIYRWGVSNLHLSGYHDTQKVYDDYALQATQEGEYVLIPHWEQDYLKKVNDLINKKVE